MKRILLIISNDEDTKKSAYLWTQKILSRECGTQRMEVRIVRSDTGLKQPSFVPHTSGWLSVEEAVSELSPDGLQQAVHERPAGEEMKDLASVLHKVADSMPYLGANLDVIFFAGFEGSDIAQSHSFIPLAGALRRLVEWHNGRAVIVKWGSGLSPLGKQLVEFGHCQVAENMDELKFDMPEWTGKIAVKDHIENKGHTFSGFSLDCQEWDAMLEQKLPSIQPSAASAKKTSIMASPIGRAVCGRTIEVLQEVDLRTFPLFLLDSWTLQLQLRQGHSDTLVRYIQNLQQTGLLARLRIYPDGQEIPTCGDISCMNTIAWKERIMADYQHVQEPDEEQVAKRMEFMYFLLLPNKKSLAKSRSPLIAQVLLSPSETNRDIFCVLENHIWMKRRQSTKERQKQVNESSHNWSSLPLLDQRDRFALMLELLVRHHNRNALQGIRVDVTKRDSENAPSSDIAETVSNIQREIVSAAFKDCETLGEYLSDNRRKKIGSYIKWVSEASVDPSKFPEKMILQVQESKGKGLQSFPSVDSFSASSPLSLAELEKKKNSTDFDVNDVLQLFNLDGSHLTLPGSPVKLKGHSLCRVESQPDLGAPWPDSQLLRYHDVYYYMDDIDWRLERKYAKLRDKGAFDETHSTFLSPVKKKPQTKAAVPGSPVRWSPRRSASSQHLMTRCRSDGLKSSSGTPKKPKVAENAFKQPAVRSCSPHKRLRLNTTFSTPDLYQQSSSDASSSSTPDFSSKSRTSPQKRLLQSQTTPSVTRALARSPKKKVQPLSAPSFLPPNRRDKKLLTLSHDTPVRRSPRKSTGSLFSSSDVSEKSTKTSKSTPRFENSGAVLRTSSQPAMYKQEASQSSCAASTQSAKMKRSDRHKMKLQRIIDNVLEEKGVKVGDTIYATCSRNLFDISMILLKTLTTSQNLTEEMKTVVYGQVTQIINLEKRRCGMNL